MTAVLPPFMLTLISFLRLQLGVDIRFHNHLVIVWLVMYLYFYSLAFCWHFFLRGSDSDKDVDDALAPHATCLMPHVTHYISPSLPSFFINFCSGPDKLHSFWQLSTGVQHYTLCILASSMIMISCKFQSIFGLWSWYSGVEVVVLDG